MRHLIKNQKVKAMRNWITSKRLYGIGAIAGALVGYIYWKYIGCLSGSCGITSNPYRSTIYFAIAGSLVFGLFKKGSQKRDDSAQV